MTTSQGTWYDLNMERDERDEELAWDAQQDAVFEAEQEQWFLAWEVSGRHECVTCGERIVLTQSGEYETIDDVECEGGSGHYPA